MHAVQHSQQPLFAVVDEGMLDAMQVRRVGDFELQEELARGGMGVVYRARQRSLDREVAVKVLLGGAFAGNAAESRFRGEMLAAGRLNHPGIVAVHDVGQQAGQWYLVMEWVAGETLWSRIKRSTPAPREAARIGRDLARALEALHLLGIVHRDIKPENVLLAPGPAPGDPATPKLIDFGLARPDDPAGHLTQVSTVIGTPSYMAPEQTGLDPLLGAVGPATDIHAIGGTLLAMLTGKAPYEGKTAADSLLAHRASRWQPLTCWAMLGTRCMDAVFANATYLVERRVLQAEDRE
jgi:serine/threonine-protein kinase